MIYPKALRHRHHRLAPPVSQQPPHIQLPCRLLIAARQATEHLFREGQQPGPDVRDLLRSHPGMTLQRSPQERETRHRT